MLDISKNNLFYVYHQSLIGVSDVLDFYDLNNLNWILIYQRDTILNKIVKNKSIQSSIPNLKNVLNQSTLFRVDLLVLYYDSDVLKIVREKTDLPVILIVNKTQNTNFNLNRYDYVYKFTRELRSDVKKIEYFVSIDNQRISLKDLKTSKIRDLKINSIIDKPN
jgi:hypothetical protein